MGQTMGRLCCSRRNPRINLNQDEIDEGAWELIPPAANNVLNQAANAPPSRPNRKFKSATKKVIRLLQLRKLWSKLGNYLDATANSRLFINRRRAIKTAWAYLGRYLRPYAATFRHLRRRNGQLHYV
jgi:hypothetical protein